ncbi:unnamed protein product [Choristocarpus tenellus]
MDRHRAWGYQRHSSIIRPKLDLFSLGTCFFWCGSTSGPRLDEIDYSLDDTFLFGRRLGHGRLSEVRHAIQRSDRNSMALKCVRRLRLTEEQEACVMEEVAVLSRLSHPNIVRLVDFHSRPDHHYLVLDLLDGGELIDSLVRRETYTEADAHCIITTLLGAMAYAHNRGVVHRNLCPEKLLLVGGVGARARGETESEGFTSAAMDWAAQLRITGWGLAKRLPQDGEVPSGDSYYGFAHGFIAPEVIEGDPFRPPADVWSLGSISHLLLTGAQPHVASTRRGRESMTKAWEAVSNEAATMVSSMLENDPKRRVTVEEVLRNPWARGGWGFGECKLREHSLASTVLPALRLSQWQGTMVSDPGKPGR